MYLLAANRSTARALSRAFARSVQASNSGPPHTVIRGLATSPWPMRSQGLDRQRASKTALFLSVATAYATLSSPSALFPAASYARAEFSTIPTNRPTPPDIVLYQYEVCPFCNKVRAYLDFHNIPYRVVEVDPLRKTELQQFPASYRKVPIVVVNGLQVNGSSDAIEHVRTLVEGDDVELSALERRWVLWVDEHFAHLIAPNIYRTASESLQTFEYIADNAKFSAWQRSTIRYSGAAAMYFVGKKLKKKYDIDDERVALSGALEDWTTAVEEGGGKFLAGDVPGVADLSVYGMLKAIQTFDTFREMREGNQKLAEWFDRTKEAVGETAITARQ